METVIIGTGIIGASTAYYLSQAQSPSTIHLIESSPTLFASASGYAGGFLSRDWFSPSSLALGALSFAEHKRLAEEHNGKEKWGYSTCTGTSYTPADSHTIVGKRGDDWLREGTSRADSATEIINESGKKESNEPVWLRREEGDLVEIISEEGSLAQVDPLRLSQFLLSQCLERGVNLHYPANATSVGRDTNGKISSVKILQNGSTCELEIHCTRLVITAGAWSPIVFETLFPEAKIELPISSLAGHSLVVRSPRWSKQLEDSGCHAVFTTESGSFAPEIFSRIGGEIYIAGLNSTTTPLPAVATESKIIQESVRQLQTTAIRLLGLPGGVNDLEVLREGLCFRPVTSRGTPILSRIPDAKLGEGYTTRGGGEGGVYLAAGHGPWGISMSLGTGKVMAEMIQGLPTSAGVEALALS